MKTNITYPHIIASLLSLGVCPFLDIQTTSADTISESTVEIQHHEFIPRITVRSKANERSAWQCSFKAFGERFNVVLESNERLVANLPRPQGTQLLDTCSLYRGQLKGVTDSWVRLSKAGQNWSGAIRDGEELYILDPVQSVRRSLATSPHPRERRHVIYKLSDVIDVQGQTCGPDSFTPAGQPVIDYVPFVEKLRKLVPLAAEGASLNLDMAVVADAQFSEIQEGTFGTPTSAAIAARINVVDGIYSEQIGVQIS